MDDLAEFLEEAFGDVRLDSRERVEGFHTQQPGWFLDAAPSTRKRRPRRDPLYLLEQRARCKAYQERTGYAASYYQEHRDVIRARRKAHYEANKAATLAKQKAYRERLGEEYREKQRLRKRKQRARAITRLGQAT